ncbi:MAG: DUF5672 family protein [Agriterribacter sp.]
MMVNVVIPIYKSHLSKSEQISLAQCCKILGSYPLTLIKPYSLDPSPYFTHPVKFNIESFDDDFFKDVRGYNRLMLSEEFYKRFLHKKYMLIYQLDAFVFRDELAKWCKKGYDYIGAPWLDTMPEGKTFWEKIKFAKRRRKEYRNNTKQPDTNLPTEIQFHNQVGNGGFSLRHVEKFYTICKEKKQQIDYYNQNSGYSTFYNEDVFWSLEVNRKKNILKIPDYKTALQFSIENRPEFALTITKGKLPFGCHAWNMFPDFWNPVIRSLGYDI